MIPTLYSIIPHSDYINANCTNGDEEEIIVEENQPIEGIASSSNSISSEHECEVSGEFFNDACFSDTNDEKQLSDM